jgi:hypothetical protein
MSEWDNKSPHPASVVQHSSWLKCRLDSGANHLVDVIDVTLATCKELLKGIVIQIGVEES